MSAKPKAIRLLDSSCWIEILSGGRLAAECEAELRAADEVVVPTVVIFEVYKKIHIQASEDQALQAVSLLQTHTVVDLTTEVALAAGDLAAQSKFAMADCMILASALATGALVVTLDNDFAKIQGVRVLR